ncbi:ABC transporter permease [Limnochorda pilosa]|uniref:ABC transporter permease n=2 Tax=Limnochorda pilosa TaxID=1555112 RepID=A0A0K2SL38_LIMPI|nr:ABC transporter permease [Limnochorda pilosa]
MLTPALLYVIVLVGIPFVLALVLSLSQASAGSLSFSFVGLKNFARVIHDPIFRRALSNTLLFTVVSQLLVVILATTLALVLNSEFRGKRLVRFLILMPWAAPIALASMAWTWIFDSTFSVINWTLRAVGLMGPGQWFYWFGDPTLATIAIVTVHVWRMLPFATVVLLAGMTSLPKDVEEAAVVDGAGFWRRLFHVDVPLLLPVVTVAVLFGVVFTATDLGVVYLLTRGGPYNTTHVLASYAFQQGILGADLGQGAAIAVFLFPLLVLVAIGMLRVARGSEVGQS